MRNHDKVEYLKRGRIKAYFVKPRIDLNLGIDWVGETISTIFVTKVSIGRKNLTCLKVVWVNKKVE